VGELFVTDVRSKPASSAQIESGLLAFVSFTFAGLRFEATLRRSRNARIYIAFPGRIDGEGERHSLVTPLTPELRTRIEHSIIEQLGFAARARAYGADAKHVLATRQFGARHEHLDERAT